MREFKKQRPNPRVLALRFAKNLVGLLLLGVIAFFAARGAWGMYQKFAEAGAARDEAQKQLAELEERDKAVKAEVAELASPRGTEAALRERYGVARPGEGELDIVRPSTNTPAYKAPQGFLGRLWHLLFVW